MFVDNDIVSSKRESIKLEVLFKGFHPFFTPIENLIR